MSLIVKPNIPHHYAIFQTQKFQEFRTILGALLVIIEMGYPGRVPAQDKVLGLWGHLLKKVFYDGP